ILGYFVLVKEKRIQIKLKDLFRRDKKLNRDFLLVGLPIVAHELIWSTGTTAGSAITGQMSTSVVGGYNVANVLYQLVACFMNGSLHACTITIGKTIGSGAGKAEIKKQAYSVLLIGGFFGSILGIVTILACVPFVGIYALSAETRVYAMKFILIFAFIWPFSGLEMTGMIATLRAGGDGKTGFISDIFTMWLITIPLASLGAFALGWSPVVVIAIIKFNIVLEALVGIWRIRSMKWVRNLTSG
ncbi:MAG: MATE family efflux transporter, partial [Hungatella sp.]